MTSRRIIHQFRGGETPALQLAGASLRAVFDPEPYDKHFFIHLPPKDQPCMWTFGARPRLDVRPVQLSGRRRTQLVWRLTIAWRMVDHCWCGILADTWTIGDWDGGPAELVAWAAQINDRITHHVAEEP